MKMKYLIISALAFALTGCAQQPMQIRVNVNEGSNQNIPPVNKPISQNANSVPGEGSDLKNEPLTFGCTTDADCTIVQRGCCNNGGASQIAINQRYQSAWKQLYNSNCQNTMCPQFMTRPATSTSCNNNKCELD